MVEGSGIGAQFVDAPADDVFAQGVDGGDLDIVATADREGEAMALVGAFGGAQDEVGGGVVGVGIHGVGPVQLP
ncbi:hypothetical protein STANM309S_05160 [Streptomyces tanashiensis]